MPLTSVSGMHVTGRLKLSDPPSEGTPRRVTQLSQYGGNLTIVLEVQVHGFHAFFTRVHGHPPFWSRILSAHPSLIGRAQTANSRGRFPKRPPFQSLIGRAQTSLPDDGHKVAETVSIPHRRSPTQTRGRRMYGCAPGRILP